MGDALGVVSVWSTGSAKATLVLRDVFEGKNRAVTDISWRRDTDRAVLACCSMDGSVVLVDFEEGLGSRMNGQALDKHFKRYYGKSHEESLAGDAPLIADPLALQYMTVADKRAAAYPGIEVGAASPHKQASGGNQGGGSGLGSRGSSNSSSSSGGAVVVPAGEQVRSLQKLSKSKDGKKRIQPVMIQDADGMAVGGQTNSSSSSSSSSSSNGNGGGAVPSSSSSGGGEKRDRQAMEQSSSSVGPGPARSAVHGNGVNTRGAPLIISFRQDEVLCTVPVATSDKGSTLRCIVKETPPVGGTTTGSRAKVNSLRVLSATTMSKPAALASRVRNSGGPLCMVRYSEADRHQRALAGSSSSSSFSSSSTGAEGGVPQEMWATPLSGTVTTIVGLAHSHLAGGGLCVVGCADGSLHVLSMASGVRLCPPLVLGTAVAFLDIRSEQAGTLAVMAVTAEGEIWLWRFQGGGMQCTLRASARSAVVSMRTRAKAEDDTSAEVSLERAFFDCNGIPSLFLSSLGALGGDWQAFTYNASSQCWIRVADLRHLLSRAFNITPRSANFAVHGTDDDMSLASLQSEAARLGGFSTRDVLALTSLTTGASSSSAGGSGTRSQADQVKEWMALTTLSHLEDRVALSFALGSEQEARSWLGEWVDFCCRSQQYDRIRWVVKRIFAGPDDVCIGGNGNGGLGDWLSGVPSKLVSEVIVASVGRAGTGSADFLAELNDAVDAHMQQ